LREADTGREVMRLPCGTDNAGGGAWSRDGSRFAAVTSYRLWVWDTKTRKLFGPEAAGNDGTVAALAFAPDGRLFTGGDDHTVREWDPTSGKELVKLQMIGWARGLALSPDGSLLAGSGLRNDLRVWDAKT